MTENIDNTLITDTEAVQEGQDNTSQVEQKTFTQDQVNEIVQKRVAQVKGKVDIDEYNELRAFKENIEEEKQISRSDFEGVLKKHKKKSAGEIANLRNELEKIKIDGALINAASTAKAVAPEQVSQLLRNNVRLDDNGKVSVVDNDGNIRFNDDAEAMTVSMLVDEFLGSNQYFKAAGPSGLGSQGNMAESKVASTDLASLDLTRPDHREQYKKLKMAGKL